MDKKIKLIQINTVCNGSTGKIMRHIQLAAEVKGYDTISFYGRRKGYTDLKSERFGDFFSFWLHVIWTTITDKHGCGSIYYTRKMVKRLREEKPDIIHLHNIHGYYLNYPLLFQYLKEEFKGKIVWTFHDCWPMTGHCAYFVMAKCDKWKKKCQNCPNKKSYPISCFLDSSEFNYELKKEYFTGFEDMTIVCPSYWLADLVKVSMLKENRIEVIPNGINFDIFYPRKSKSVLQKYEIPETKKIILGVASIWEERKGLNIFHDLAKKISKDYVMVLVGLNKYQIRGLKEGMIGIERTENQEELAELYSHATVFLNPSKEETFSLVTIEAIACGTPVIALDSSAVKELVTDKNGIVLHEPEIADYMTAIETVTKRYYDPEELRASVSCYSAENMSDKYLKCYTLRVYE